MDNALASSGKWGPLVINAGAGRADKRVLRQLVDQEISVLVIKDLLNEMLLQKGLELIFSHYEKKTASRYHNGTLTTIGPYLARHLSDLDHYFANNRVMDEVFANSDFDLRQIVQSRLQSLLGLKRLEVETEADGRRYADSIIRIHGDGVANPLHNDNIMRDAASSKLKLAKLVHQLSCVVCIQECDRGGELVTYRKRWTPEDERFKIKGGLGYDSGVITGVEQNVFRPHQGDVYVINPTSYHEILEVAGKDRITLSFFIGFYGDNLEEAILWS
jgi:hypothetical protein